MKILIVDDEPLARARLRGLLAELAVPDLSVDEAGNGQDALALALKAHPDVILMDIQMPILSGLDCARQLARTAEGPAIIFVTAYDDYAVEAFEVSACDYLLKPVRRERLAAALQRARRFGRGDWERLAKGLPEGARARCHLCCVEPGGVRVVAVRDVLYFLADQKSTIVRTVNTRFYLDEPLKTLEAELSAEFVRVHRNALVSLAEVERLDRLPGGGVALKLKGIPERIEVSRRHLPQLRRSLGLAG